MLIGKSLFVTFAWLIPAHAWTQLSTFSASGMSTVAANAVGLRSVSLTRAAGQLPGVTLPRGKTVNVDGNSDPGEWDDATEVPIQVHTDWVVRVRIKHDGENLLFGFFGLRNDSVRVPEVLIDPQRDGGNVWKPDDWWFHASARDCWSTGKYNDYSTCVAEASDWSATNVRGMIFPQVMELRIPMRLVAVAPGQTIGLALNVTDTRAIWNFWPDTARLATPGSWAPALLQQ